MLKKILCILLLTVSLAAEPGDPDVRVDHGYQFAGYGGGEITFTIRVPKHPDNVYLCLGFGIPYTHTSFQPNPQTGDYMHWMRRSCVDVKGDDDDPYPKVFYYKYLPLGSYIATVGLLRRHEDGTTTTLSPKVVEFHVIPFGTPVPTVQ